MNFKKIFSGSLLIIGITCMALGYKHPTTPSSLPINNQYHSIDMPSKSLKLKQTVFSLEKNYYHDIIHSREQNSTIILFKMSPENNGDTVSNKFSLDLATGVVINNSATQESGGHNVILSAGHVLTDQPSLFPRHCLENELCLAYNANGEYIGQYDLLEYAANDHKLINKKEVMNTDIITLSIIPSDNKFDDIPGVHISKTQSDQILFMKTSANIPYDHGSSNGLSGGGVFNKKGELIGILTSALKYNYFENQFGEIKTDKNFTYNSIIPLIIKKENDETFNNRYLKNIYTNFQDKNINNTHMENNISVITPINNSHIIKSLGKAGYNIDIKPKPVLNPPFVIYGFPEGNALEYRIDNIANIKTDDDLNLYNISLNLDISNDLLWSQNMLGKIFTFINKKLQFN